MKVAILITAVAVAFFVWAGGRALDHEIQRIDNHIAQIDQAGATP